MNHWMTAMFCLVLATVSQAEERMDLQDLRWLLGNWEHEGAKALIGEEWSEAGHTVWTGLGRQTSRESGDSAISEELLLAELGGEVYYIAKVDHNSMPIPFRLVELEENRARFENLEHDFPKRIEYRRITEDRIDVRVSDVGEKGFELHFTRKPGSPRSK